MSDHPANPKESEISGTLLGVITYVCWGLMPLLLHALRPSPPIHILCFRVVASLPVLLALAIGTGHAPGIRAILADPARLKVLVFSALIIAGNWLLYIYGVAWGRLVDVSLGYFIIPFISAGTGALLLKERLSRFTQIAIALALVGVILLIVERHAIPIIAVTLAVTFVLYAYVRKEADIGPIEGMTVETIVLFPFALAWLVIDGGFSSEGPGPDASIQMIACGSMAIPMLLFTVAAKRMRLVDLGFLQYISPSIQLGLAVFFYREDVSAAEFAAFSFIWAGLALHAAMLWRSRIVLPAEPVTQAR